MLCCSNVAKTDFLMTWLIYGKGIFAISSECFEHQLVLSRYCFNNFPFDVGADQYKQANSKQLFHPPSEMIVFKI